MTQKRPVRRYMEALHPDWQGQLSESRAETYNLAPSALAWTVRINSTQPAPSLLRWGYGDDVVQGGLAPINARVETAATKYLFRDAWMKRRCIVPADGWYEWRAEAAGKQPYYFVRADNAPVFFAGLWTASTFCLFTTAADGELTSIHDRKPLSLTPENAIGWLKNGADTDSLVRSAVTGGAFRFFPVAKAVSNWRNDGPHLIEPISQPRPEEQLL